MSALSLRELTAPGRGGLSVLELRGEGALRRVARLCPDARLEPGRIVLARLGEADDPLDEALVVVHTDARIELHLHGAPALVRELVARLGADPAPAPPRTPEARAETLLASAPCEAAARILLDQVEGALRREVEALLAAPPRDQDARLDALLARSEVLQRLLHPPLVVLAGPANAGKSTLFNALVGAERALVTDTAGTTRDVLVERAHLGPYPVDLADGPGERAADASDRGALLEREGGRLARGLMERAALVLWLSPAGDPTDPPRELAAGRLLAIASQGDRLGARPAPSGPTIAARPDPRGAAETVARIFAERLGLPPTPWERGAAVAAGDDALETLRRARRADASERAHRLRELLGRPATETADER